MSIILRPVNVLDATVAASITQLNDECFGDEDKGYKPHPGYWWIAFDGKEPAGFAGITPSVQFTNAGYLCRAAVLPQFRGRGLQKRLIRIRLNRAKKLGWESVVTDTNGNPASSNSLIACGFRIYEPKAPWGFPTAVYWKKKL